MYKVYYPPPWGEGIISSWWGRKEGEKGRENGKEGKKGKGKGKKVKETGKGGKASFSSLGKGELKGEGRLDSIPCQLEACLLSITLNLKVY